MQLPDQLKSSRVSVQVNLAVKDSIGGLEIVVQFVTFDLQPKHAACKFINRMKIYNKDTIVHIIAEPQTADIAMKEIFNFMPDLAPDRLANRGTASSAEKMEFSGVQLR
ncbi:MAG TPA: hypothetical protein VN753_20005 [Terracidiphilus sp.]|nr:hypothetical protein [Terracidiphilus sp.]